MSLWNKVKSWFSKKFGGGSSNRSYSRSNYRSPSQRSSSGGSYSSGGSDYNYNSRADELRERQEELRRKREEAKRKKEEQERNRKRLETYKAKDANYKSMAQDVTNTVQDTAKALTSAVTKANPPATRKENINKIKAFKNTKATVDDEYAITDAGKKAIEKVRKQKEAEKQKYKLTNKDYEMREIEVPNTDATGNWDGTYKKVKVKALNEKGYEKKLKGDKAYRYWESGSRGLLSGATFGASELAMRKGLKNDSHEKVYQKNKSKGAETVGDLAGSFVGFGQAAKAAEKGATKLAGTKAGQKLTAKLAEKKLVKASAKRAVDKAVKKGLVKEGSEELLKKTAQEKASKLVKAIGEDAIVNATVGGASDVMRASTEHKVGSKEWKKELALSAGLNLGVGGAAAVATSGALGKKAALDAADALKTSKLDDVLKAARKTDDVKVSLNRKSKRDVVLPNERPNAGNVQSTVKSNVVNEADEAAEFTRQFREDPRFAPFKRYDELEQESKSIIDQIVATGSETEAQTRRLDELALEMNDIENANGGRNGFYERRQQVSDSIRKDLVDNIRAENAPKTARNIDEVVGAEPIRKPKEIIEGYESVGSKKKLAAVEKRAKKLIAEGDINGAKAEIEKTVDDIVSNTKNLMELDAAEKELQEEIRNTRFKISSTKAKKDAGYKAGGFNELRKKNFGTLNITNDGVDVDKVWQSLRENYGNLLPADIDDPSAQLEFLANLAKKKGNYYSLADDEAQALKEQLLDSIWESANEGVEHAPFRIEDANRLTEELASTPMSADELANIERNMIDEGEVLPPRKASEVIPNTKDDTVIRANMTDEEINRIAESPNRTINDEIRKAVPEEDRARWSPEGEKEGYTVKDAEEIWEKNYRDNDVHTKQGAFTITTGAGDKHFAGTMKDAIDNGEMHIEVYHDKENYSKGIERVLKYADGVGGEGGHGNIDTLIERFSNYANGKLKVDSRESRDMLYDILAAVDYANGNKNAPWAEDLFLSATKAGAELTSVSGLSLRQWQKIAMSSPDHRAKAVRQQIAEMFNKSRGFRKKFGKLEGGVESIDDFIKAHPKETEGLQAGLDELAKATSVDEVQEKASEVLLEARKVIPVTAFDQITQWRYVAMLSSPTTHVKNIVGNIYSGTLGQMSGAIAKGTEERIIKKAQRGVKGFENVNAEDYLKSSSGLSIKARNNAKVGVFEGIKLDNAKNALEKAKKELKLADDGSKAAIEKKIADLEKKVTSAEEAYSKAKPKDPLGAKAQESWLTRDKESLVMDAEKFEQTTNGVTGKIIGKASNVIGKALETSDAVAVERLYRESYEKVLRANGYEDLVKRAAEVGDGKEGRLISKQIARIEEYASQHASYKAALDTYRNYNAVASWISETVNNTLYNADAAWYKKAGGFALNAVMPFTKVPTNIFKRSLDYSPIGLLEGKKMLNEALKSGNYAEINKAAERLAEGKIGTGIAALGMGLGMIDPDGFMITGRLDRNDELDKSKRDRGYMDYSLKVGNKDYTLEWATPTASTLFVGVEIGRVLRNIWDDVAANNGLEFKPYEAFESAQGIMSALMEPTMQLSMFQGINNIIEDATTQEQHGNVNVHPIIKAAGNIASNYINSLSPTVVNRLAKAFAPYDYYISGDNDFEYKANSMLSKVPIYSKMHFDAKTNAWGEIKNEKKNAKDYLVKGATTLFSPMNVSDITWDKTDTDLYNITKSLGKKGEGIMPKVFYGTYDDDGNFSSNISFGRNEDTALSLKLSNNDKAQYNIARSKAGADAIETALESVIFNRWSKDSKGKYTVENASNYTPAMKASKIAEFKGKSVKDAVAWLIEQPEFKNASKAEQAQVLKQVMGKGGSDESTGMKKTSELAVAKRHDISEGEYNYKNEVPAKVQAKLDSAIDSGLITYEQAVDYARHAGKTYYRTDETGEKGGTVTTRFNKKEQMAYLQKMGYSYEEAEALYNAFKADNTKPFNGIDLSSGRKGYRRRGYRRYRRRYSSTPKTVVPKSTIKINANAYKPNVAKTKSMAEGLPTGKGAVKIKAAKTRKSAATKSSLKTAKITPPKVKFKKYEV